jgi:hypothetical protein
MTSIVALRISTGPVEAKTFTFRIEVAHAQYL